MSSSDDETTKNVKEDVEILVSFEGHNRIGRLPMGSAGEDLRGMCKQLFAEKNLEEFDIKYYSPEWDEWVDVVQQFLLVQRHLKIKIDRSADAEEVVGESLEEGTNKRKLTSLVGMLMKNRSQTKNSSEGEHGPSASGTRSKKEEIQVHIGWQHCKTTNTDPPHYVQVRANTGGGVVPTKMRRTDATYETVLQKAKDIFFPNGKSTCHGDANDLEFHLANYRGQSLYDNFSLDALFENKSRARMYLMSRPKIPAAAAPGPSTRSSSSSSSSLMDPLLSEFGSEFDSGTPTVKLRSPDVDFKCTICSDRIKTSFFIPCGHCICMTCGMIYTQDTKSCPFCKAPVERMGSLF